MTAVQTARYQPCVTVYLDMRTKLADKVELLAAVPCALPLEARVTLDQSTGRLRIWHVHPVAVADIGAI